MTIENERGTIAETYEKLQGLHILSKARTNIPLPKASAQSALRAILQAAEITLLNLSDLISRVSEDIEQKGITGSAVVKMSWARDFHGVMIRISMMPQQLGFGYQGSLTRMSVAESSAYGKYESVLRAFDQSIIKQLTKDNLNIESILGDQSIDSDEFKLLHLIRICNHETEIWDCNFDKICVPEVNLTFNEFVGSACVQEAVYDMVLNGDTYLMQFRGLHQISEILGEEINSRLEEVIQNLRQNYLQQAVEYMYSINILTEGILATLPPMIDNLSTVDYHQIRENLGQTSGSHSFCLHQRLFRDLYEKLWEAMVCRILGDIPRGCIEETIRKAIHQLDRRRFHNVQDWMMYLLVNECLKLRAFIFHWRETHLHLTRNELGGNFTKSLIGSPDAVKKVKYMRNKAQDKDPMRNLAYVRGLLHEEEPKKTRVSTYINSDTSLDNQVLTATGNVTKKRFIDIQTRSGFFKYQCPFKPS